MANGQVSYWLKKCENHRHWGRVKEWCLTVQLIFNCNIEYQLYDSRLFGRLTPCDTGVVVKVVWMGRDEPCTHCSLHGDCSDKSMV